MRLDGDKIQGGSFSILKLSFHDELDEALLRNLYASATRDALTGAANKRMFGETPSKEIAFAKRHATELSLLTFDVDHFKRVNAGFGHPCGDYVLKTLADKVRGSLCTEDELARVGGEEFAVLLRDTDGSGAFECAERVRSVIAATVFMWEGKRVPVTVSVGIATFDANGGRARPRFGPAALSREGDGAKSGVCGGDDDGGGCRGGFPVVEKSTSIIRAPAATLRGASLYERRRYSRDEDDAHTAKRP